VKTVNLSQQPESYTAQRIKTDVIITLYDNIVENKIDGDEPRIEYTADMYQLKLQYRSGILSADNYEAMLDFAKRLHNPQTDADIRQARDVLYG
jgi:SNF2 family DNA or RNA helicase